MDIHKIIGRTFTSVGELPNREGIYLSDGKKKVIISHVRDCCERVDLEDIVGDLSDLVGHPILRAEERTSSPPTEGEDSSTWTFYELATILGSVTLRFYGESNGYYSETADVWEEDCL